MPYYAQLDDARRVVAVVETAGTLQGDHLVALDSLDESLLGQVHDAEGGTFTPTAAPAADRRITILAFKQRLTAAERKAIRAAAKTDEDVEDFVDLCDSATFIDLSRADTQAYVQALEAASLLGAGRAAQVLQAEIRADERIGGAV